MRLYLDDPDWDGKAVVFDVETTGVKPEEDRIVSLAMFKADFSELVTDGEMTSIESYEIVLHPGRPIPEETTEIHGITDAQVKDCPQFAEVAQEIRDWIGDLPVIAHNAKFDTGMLNAEFERAEVESIRDNPTFCTMWKFREELNDGEWKGSRLEDAAKRMGIDGRSGKFHGAKEDALLCLKIAANFYAWEHDLDLIDANGSTETGRDSDSDRLSPTSVAIAIFAIMLLILWIFG